MTIATFVNELRSLGVKSFKGQHEGQPIEVELGPVVAPDAAPLTKEERDADRCACKCPIYEHNNGLCLNNCDPSLCAPEVKP